jgi:DNA mismatch repair protein MutS
MLRDRVRFLLKEVADLERLVGRVNLGTASARDLLALNRSMSQVPDINASLSDATSLLLQVLNENIFPLPELTTSSRVRSPTSPGQPRRWRNDPRWLQCRVDELRNISRSAKQTIAAFEEQEKARTGIGNLKVRFNNRLRLLHRDLER